MSSPQGTFGQPIPDSLKNAIELAQNRLSSMASEEDRRKRYKMSLDNEISALEEIRDKKIAENSELDNQAMVKKNAISLLGSEVTQYLAKHEEATSKYQAIEVCVASAEADLKETRITLVEQGRTIDLQKKEIVDNGSIITTQKGKIDRFLEAVHNLL